ncbi:MAG TPA: hypothetical protein VJ255_06715, partial [Candidatus Acidoferrum sp.]|nr:hypothetical protein [Candidatus Acidoferrum sp.]
MAWGGADLVEERAEAEGVAGAVSKAGFRVQVGEFPDRRNEFGLEPGRRSELEGSLRGAAGVATPFEKAKKFGIEAGSEQRIGLAGRGAAELQSKTE